MSSCLIEEKDLSLVSYDTKMPVRLWTLSYTNHRTCLPGAVPRTSATTVAPGISSSPQELQGILKDVFTTNHIFSSVLPQSSSRSKINLTKKKDTSLRDKVVFGCSDSETTIWGKRKEAAVLNLALSVKTQTSCSYLQVLICLSIANRFHCRWVPSFGQLE